MCGRFTLHTPIDELLERFYLPGFDLDYSPSYNIAPTQEVLTIVSKGGERSLIPMRWGLVPPWQKEVKGRPPLINAPGDLGGETDLSQTRQFKPLSDCG